jgi:hypothetical protein
VYPLGPELLHELAYFFVDERRSSASRLTPGIRALGARVIEWQRAFRRAVPPILSLTDSGEAIDILDTRPCAVERRATLTGLEADVYRACEPAVAARELARRLGRDEAGRGPEQIRAAIEDLKRRRLLLELNGKCLALAVEGDLPTMRDYDDFRGGSVMSFDPRTAGSVKDAWTRLRERLAVGVTG